MVLKPKDTYEDLNFLQSMMVQNRWIYPVLRGNSQNENGNNIRAKGDKNMQNSALTPSWIVRIIR